MGNRESYTPGTFCWVELATTHGEAAKAFYGELFGWKAKETADRGGYSMMQLNGRDVAGLYEMGAEMQERGVPANWLSYVSVDDVDAVAGRAKELEGSVHAGPIDLPGAGRMVLLRDPAGAMIAAWEPRGQIGATVVNAPGSLTWNELVTPDPEAAIAFYTGLFGWDTEQPAPEYCIVKSAGASNGGIRKLTEGESGIPTHWIAYFTVSSCEHTVLEATRLGGRVLAGPISVPKGSFAAITDPQGAVFAVFEGETDD